MSEAAGQRDKETEGQGPNLVLVYGLIVLFFLIAAGCAALIVLPFYHRH
jgi:hypothetical protein